MLKRGLIVVIVITAIATPLLWLVHTWSGSANVRSSKIGFVYLGSTDPTYNYPLLHPFLQGLEDENLIDGKNIALEIRDGGGSIAGLRAAIQELVSLPVDILVVPESVGVPMAAEITDTTPIISALIGDPRSLGLATSLAQPTRNVTGLTIQVTSLTAKRLEYLLRAAPHRQRVGLLYNAAYIETEVERMEFAAGANRMGIVPIELPVQDISDFANAFQRAIEQEVDGVVVVPDSLTNNQRKGIVEFSLANRLPMIGAFREFAAAGGMLAYAPDRLYNMRRIGFYVRRLLNGSKPNDLPFEQASRFELVANLSTAKQLGFELDRSLLLELSDAVQ